MPNFARFIFFRLSNFLELISALTGLLYLFFSWLLYVKTNLVAEGLIPELLKKSGI